LLWNFKQMETRDDVLLKRISSDNDQKAFEILYHLYFSPMCGYALGFVKSYADAEDLVNDCFFELWKTRKSIEIKSSLKSYLFISVRNRSINFLKRKLSRQRYIEDQSYPFAFEDEIVHQSELLLKQENLDEKLKKAIEKLPAQCRQIFYMNRFEGLKYKEIAFKLNLAEATIKTQIARALKSLRSDLESFKSSFLLFFGIKTGNL